MPGPMSAPNGGRTVVTDGKKREKLRDQGKLRTGKTKQQKGE